MKYLFRTLIILLVIGLVAGGLYLILNNNTSMPTGLPGEDEAPQYLSESENFNFPVDEIDQLERRPPSENDFVDREFESSRGLFSLGEVLIKFVGIVVVVTLIQWGIRLIKRRKTATPSAA